MLFLIEYDRRGGTLTKFESFPNDQNDDVLAKRAKLEISLRDSGKLESHEVVILQAKSEAILRRTHRRYFETTESIINGEFARAA